MSSQILFANEVLGAKVLAVDKDGDVRGGDGSSNRSKHVEPKTGRSESQKSAKSQKLSKSKKSKAKKLKKPSKSENSSNFDTKNSEPSFLTPKAKLALNRLWLTFIKVPILQHFDLEYHIWIKTEVLGYTIGGVLYQLASKTRLDGVITKTNLEQWHSIAFFSRKTIPVEIHYKTHNGELLAIVKVFKTWRHYLEDCKYEVSILTDHNDLYRFMDTKNPSFWQVWWAQKLSWYYFQIDYCQDKENAAIDALLRFFQKSQNKKDELQAENSQIFHCLQNSLTNASLARLSFSWRASHLHQVFICGTYVLLQLQ